MPSASSRPCSSLHKPEPDSAHLSRLDKSAGLLNQVLDYLEEAV
jgi:hypothetical protein